MRLGLTQGNLFKNQIPKLQTENSINTDPIYMKEEGKSSDDTIHNKSINSPASQDSIFVAACLSPVSQDLIFGHYASEKTCYTHKLRRHTRNI